MSPDVFLSSFGIRSDNVAGLPGNPSEMVSLLKQLNAMRSVVDGKLVDTVYRTPGFSPSPINPETFSLVAYLAFSRAHSKYVALMNSGATLDAIHAAIDEVNFTRMATGGAEFAPQKTDFEYVVMQKTKLGALAGLIASERQSMIDTGGPSFDHSPLPWFDTVNAWKALTEYVEYFTPTTPPTSTPFRKG